MSYATFQKHGPQRRPFKELKNSANSANGRQIQNQPVSQPELPVIDAIRLRVIPQMRFYSFSSLEHRDVRMELNKRSDADGAVSF